MVGDVLDQDVYTLKTVGAVYTFFKSIIGHWL